MIETTGQDFLTTDNTEGTDENQGKIDGAREERGRNSPRGRLDRDSDSMFLVLVLSVLVDVFFRG